MQNYQTYEAEGLNFYFKEDLNPVTNENDLHIWIRHCIEPETAIDVFFSMTNKSYNRRYKRWEGYSQEHDLYIYYFFLNKPQTDVIIISVFSE